MGKKFGVRISREQKESGLLKWYKDQLYIIERHNPPNLEDIEKCKKEISRLELRIEKEHSIHSSLSPSQADFVANNQKMIDKLRNKAGKHGVQLSKKEMAFLQELNDIGK